MKIEILKKEALGLECEVLVIPVFSDIKRLPQIALDADEAMHGAIQEFREQEGFTGSFGASLVLPTLGHAAARRVVLLGLGSRKQLDQDAWRKFGGLLVKCASHLQAENVVLAEIPLQTPGEFSAALQACVEGMHLSAYRFHTYHGRLRKAEREKKQVARVGICVRTEKEKASAKQASERAFILSQATIAARDLVNTSSMHLAPKDMAKKAKELEQKNLHVELLDRKAMERLGMGAALSVAIGSANEPIGVHLTYKPRKAKKRIAIIGKAVTFDSGGLSLKPAEAMMGMKMDMAGGAAVLGIFQALPALKLDVEVHGIFLAVENMPSGSAYRPGDIVTAMDGTTIEIHNTDAEGRVTLADAIAYAKTIEPDMIVDLATLTGACIAALGDDIAGLFSNDQKLTERLKRASAVTGEAIWEMPMPPQYMEHVKSPIADLKNVGKKGSAGAIAGAMFLKPFAGDTPWAHLDIAGPAYVERETRADMPYGGTGFGVRLMVEFLKNL